MIVQKIISSLHNDNKPGLAEECFVIICHDAHPHHHSQDLPNTQHDHQYGLSNTLILATTGSDR
jgi:hypothetical protein